MGDKVRTFPTPAQLWGERRGQVEEVVREGLRCRHGHAKIALELNRRELTTRFGEQWTADNVQHWASRRGIKSPVVRRSASITPENLKRAEVLIIGEGMPASWAAEGMGVNYKTVSRRFTNSPGRQDATREWRRVWAEIFRSPELLELHQELAPKHSAHAA
ncbi:MAG: hypothetical protein K0S37_769 [Microbacterium sp.]|nr:hypothetical protein [Microbacterium sp.]